LQIPTATVTGPTGDCDDVNETVNPGSFEGSDYGDTCSDGLDNDCDGVTDTQDESCESSSPWSEAALAEASVLQGAPHEESGIVNRFAQVRRQVTDHHGGDLLKFGGDDPLVRLSGEDRRPRGVEGRHEDTERGGVDLLRRIDRLGDVVLSIGAFFPPTILEGVPRDAKVCTEEAFAPVVVVETFRDSRTRSPA
jgi:hypothetical protein